MKRLSSALLLAAAASLALVGPAVGKRHRGHRGHGAHTIPVASVQLTCTSFSFDYQGFTPDHPVSISWSTGLTGTVTLSGSGTYGPVTPPIPAGFAPVSVTVTPPEGAPITVSTPTSCGTPPAPVAPAPAPTPPAKHHPRPRPHPHPPKPKPPAHHKPVCHKGKTVFVCGSPPPPGGTG